MKVSNVHKNTSRAKKKDAVESTQRVALTEQNKLRMTALKNDKEYAKVLFIVGLENKNYKERGKEFNDIVMRLKNEKTLEEDCYSDSDYISSNCRNNCCSPGSQQPQPHADQHPRRSGCRHSWCSTRQPCGRS